MPVINKDVCVRCGGCVSGYDGSHGCPTKAIELKDDEISIDPEKCVDCGKCIDLCALGAIE